MAVIPVRLTADQKLAEEAVEILWLTVTASTTKTVVYLRNGPNDGSPIEWNCAVVADGSDHFSFDPSMLFTHGLYADVDANVSSVVIAYRSAKESGEV
jgi:hypothetical protein